jgi:flagellar biogenesis protein FliO
MKLVMERSAAVVAGLILASAVAAAPLDTPATTIPFKRERAAVEFDSSRLAAGAAFAMLALGAGLYVLRRRLSLPAGLARDKMLRMVEMRRLTPRSSLHVVEFSGFYYLLAHSEQGVQWLDKVACPAEPEEP